MLFFSGSTESSKEQHLFDFVILSILVTPNFVNTTNGSVYSKLSYLFRWSKYRLKIISKHLIVTMKTATSWDRPRHAGVMLVNFDLRQRKQMTSKALSTQAQPITKTLFWCTQCQFKGMVQQNIHIMDSQLDHYLWQGDLVSSRRCLFLDNNPVDCMRFG